MDPTLYRAAMEGKVQILLQYSDQLEVQETPNGNTLLHIAAMFGKEECVEVLLRNFPSIFTRQNINGKTALHIAAREGHLAATRALITFSYEQHETNIFRLTSNDGNTALHEAVRFRHPNVAKLLVEQDPEFPHHPNKANQTPLYLAAKNGLDNCVSNIIQTCKSPSHSGPGGQNALHTAVIFNSQESTMILLHWKPILSEEADEIGWTPLHYAAHLGHVERVSQLLNFNRRVAYATTDNGEMTTALHLAAICGHINIIQEIISHCPDCSEMVNSSGQNILHAALENNAEEVVKFILETPTLMNLIGQEDNEGNAPIHLLEALNAHDHSNLVTHPKPRLNFDKAPSQPIIAEGQNYYELDTNEHERGIADEINVNIVKDQIITVNREMTKATSISNHHQVPDVTSTKKRAYNKDVIDGCKKMGETHLIVAALVATVAFTAGFTMPGGYNQGDSQPANNRIILGGYLQNNTGYIHKNTSSDGYIQKDSSSNEGMAVLTRHMAFKAFIITDTIALVFSTSAIFIYIGLDVDEKPSVLMHLIELARTLVLLSIEAMMAAFIAGTYAVLQQYSVLAITVCVIGCCSFLIHLVIVFHASILGSVEDRN